MTFLSSTSLGRRTAGAVAVLVLLTSAVACGSDSPETSPPSDDQSQEPTSAPATPTPSEDPEPSDPEPTEKESSPPATTTEAGKCDGVITAKSVTEVRVPENATCRLEGTRVDGNISVGRGGTLVARGITVDGDIEAEGARSVEVSRGSDVGGNLQVQRGGSVRVTDTKIDGDLEWEELSGRLLAQGNTVGGNVESDRNSGQVMIAGNKIDGDLSCEENRSIVGGRNQVRGEREGQCRGF